MSKTVTAQYHTTVKIYNGLHNRADVEDVQRLLEEDTGVELSSTTPIVDGEQVSFEDDFADGATIVFRSQSGTKG